jgi:hypothetical protein
LAQLVAGKRISDSPPVIREIARLILEAKCEFPLRVGIDGIDAAGKTCMERKNKEPHRNFPPFWRVYWDGSSKLFPGWWPVVSQRIG